MNHLKIHQSAWLIQKENYIYSGTLIANETTNKHDIRFQWIKTSNVFFDETMLSWKWMYSSLLFGIFDDKCH